MHIAHAGVSHAATMSVYVATVTVIMILLNFQKGPGPLVQCQHGLWGARVLKHTGKAPGTNTPLLILLCCIYCCCCTGPGPELQQHRQRRPGAELRERHPCACVQGQEGSTEGRLPCVYI
jgi:hypothetical protein